MARGRDVPFVVALALAVIAVAAAGDASAERARKPLRYIFLGEDSIRVGRSRSIARAMNVGDLDGLRRAMPGATFGNSYPHRRLLAWNGDAGHARYVVLVDPGVDSERIADVVEMFDAPVAIVVPGARPVIMGRATNDDPSPYELLLDRTTSTLYDTGDGHVKPLADVDVSAVGVRAKSATAFASVLASLDALAASDQAVPLTVLARNPRARLQTRVRFTRPTLTGTLDPAVLDRELYDLRSQISRCYARERADDPTIEGAMTLELDVDADGAVTDARAFGPPAMATCAIQGARGLHLTPPASGTATVTYPMQLVP